MHRIAPAGRHTRRLARLGLAAVALFFLWPAYAEGHARADSSGAFADGFESGDLSAWSAVQAGGGGAAIVQSAMVKSGSYAAQLSATSAPGSYAYARETLPAARTDLTAGGDFQISGEGAPNSNVPLLQFLTPSGTPLIILYRQNHDADQVWLQYDGTTYHQTSATFPLNTWGHFDMHVVAAGSGVSTVQVYFNGTLVYQTATANLDPAGVQTVQLGNQVPGQAFTLVADNIGVSSADPVAGALAAPADVTVAVDQTAPITTSQLALGVTHAHYSLDAGGDATAVANGKALLAAAATYQNQHIYGWGATNPEPSPGHYDWTSLDRRIALIRSMGATPVITLCCAPDWMTSLGTTTSTYPNIPPTAAHIADFAALCAAIARRYPDVTHFQVWNEMKGYWSPGLGNWDYVAYTRLFNAVADALKAVNPQIQVGGPYLAIAGGSASLTGRDLTVLQYWLAHERGADFITVDHSVVPFGSPTVPDTATILAGSSQMESLSAQIRALTPLPLWWAEDYFDADLTRLGYADYGVQTAMLTSMLVHEIKGGAAVSLRWQPQGVQGESFGGDQEGLFSDTRVSGGGQPFPYYYAFKAIHDDFGPGTPLYATTSTSPAVEALASPLHTLLINKSPNALTVSVEGTVVALGAYEVSVLSAPAAGTGTVTPTTTGTVTVTPTTTGTVTATATVTPTAATGP